MSAKPFNTINTTRKCLDDNEYMIGEIKCNCPIDMVCEYSLHILAAHDQTPAEQSEPEQWLQPRSKPTQKPHSKDTTFFTLVLLQLMRPHDLHRDVDGITHGTELPAVPAHGSGRAFDLFVRIGPPG
jgi:hypothetical protein